MPLLPIEEEQIKEKKRKEEEAKLAAKKSELTPQQRAENEKKVVTLCNWAMTHIDLVKTLVMNLKFSLANSQVKVEVDGIATKIEKYLPEVEKIRKLVPFRQGDKIEILPSDTEMVKTKKKAETNIYLVNIALTAMKREIGSILARSAAEDLGEVVQYVKIIREIEAL